MYSSIILFQVAKMNVTCGKDFISILVDEELFKYYNVGIEAVHLTNASCRAHREEISGSVYFTVHTPMDQYTACGGKPLEVKYSSFFSYYASISIFTLHVPKWHPL